MNFFSLKTYFNLITLFIFLSTTFKISLSYTTGNSFSIITPLEISEKIEKLNIQKLNEIPYKIGKFGDIPFGKTVLAMLFLQTQNDGSNYWCNYDSTQIPSDLKTYSNIYKEYLPMYVVDQGQCSYSKKALNVQYRNGGAMLIIDDDNDLENNDKYNILDLRGNSIKIPTLIIPRNYGDIIKNYFYTNIKKGLNHFEPIILSVKFSAYNPEGKVEMNLFMSSDDLNAIYFFKEFNYYKNQLGNKLVFTPVYKYHRYQAYESSNNIEDENAPCFSKNKLNFCSTNNTDLNIYNPRLVLLENLRQSCIFINYGIDVYWKYMIEFGNKCANIEKPIFNEECSLITLYTIGFTQNNYTKIKNCMQDLIDYNSKVDEDYQLYNYRKIYEYPLITLNGIKFKGMWLPRTIFNSICESFINDEKICGSPNVEELSKDQTLYSKGLIMFIASFVCIFTIILILCYRRIVFRDIEETLVEKIQTETIRSIDKFSKAKIEKNKLNDEEENS